MQSSDIPDPSKWRRIIPHVWTPLGKYVYTMWIDDKLFYIGRSTTTRRRFYNHSIYRQLIIHATLTKKQFTIRVKRCNSKKELFSLETQMINHYRPPLNRRMRSTHV